MPATPNGSASPKRTFPVTARGPEDYRQAIRYWKAHADPDGRDPGGGSRRELWLSPSFEGEGILKARLDPEAFSTVKAALGGVVDELWRDSDDDPDARIPPSEQRAEAFVELCRRGGAVTDEGEPHRRTRPQVVVTIDHDNLVSELGLGEFDTGAAVSAAAVRRLACDADVIAAVFGADTELLDLGRRARLVSPAQRLALVMRYRGCAFPNCDRPADWCDAHHIDHWIEGGPTDLHNLCLLCSKHHHLIHEGGWTLHRGRDDDLVFTNAAGLVLPNGPRRAGHPDPWLRHPPGGDPAEARPIEPEPPARRAPDENDR